MKSLKQHIEEKLVINKNFKSYNGPNDSGVFLQLSMNHRTNPDNNRIDISVEKYKYNQEKDKFTDFDDYYKNINNNSGYKKNKKGYYYNDTRYGGKWIYLALFGNEAINFLHTLLNDTNRKFDLSEFFDDSQQNWFVWPKPIFINNAIKILPITSDEIKNMIKTLNEKTI